ncbi:MULTISPECIES: SPFH domain-containing protein [Barrientosiimonas]|uniref:Band 7 domain-containing protein n=1 Tax=Barrientosiimonas endolithica TaxID=1535208 RepID=A0ABM8HET5_9MICO|nr:SPFH domain-containing protein [Barrientosiimonas endolithica]BDZ59520.1 hypothetical protein GCM10025872_31770 [Barrientosiimonas endolithica]
MSLFHITVPPRQCALAYKHGRLLKVLTAGRHPRTFGADYVWVDLRESLLPIASQEVATADGLVVKVSAVVRFAVVDPVAYVELTADPTGVVYLAAQVAIRDAVAQRDLEQIATRAALPGDALTEAVDTATRAVGVGVLEVVVKDVVVPAEVRRAATELVTARQRGAALLEQARAETAALRSLANGAKLLDAHPALAQLRMVQSVPQGSQVVVRVGDTGREE